MHSTTSPPAIAEPSRATGYLTLSSRALLNFFLLVATIGFVSMALGDHPTVTPTRLLLGPLFGAALAASLPGNPRNGRLDRIVFTLLAMGAGVLVYELVLWTGRLPADQSEMIRRVLSGPREESLKLIGALVLARGANWARGWPNRLVILSVAVALCFAGLENLDFLPTLKARVLFTRSTAIVAHISFTGIAMSGLVMAQYIRSPLRWCLPVVTTAAGMAAHSFHNLFLRIIHGNLLAHVDTLPPVMTSQQWFGAPHYDELMVLVNGGYVLCWLGILVLMVIRIHRLAQTREARP